MENETLKSLLEDLGLSSPNSALELLAKVDSKHLRDLRMNLNAFARSKDLNAKEVALMGLAIACNNQNQLLQSYFSQKALAAGATDLELSEMLACASVMSANNILYRFRHFMGKETYDKMPAGIRMNIMMGPSVGKEFFELCSLAISAVNGCEACVTAHEAAVRNLGTSEGRVFESIKLASIVTAVGKNIY